MTITVTCPSCSTVFPVDPAKVPEGGVNARCSVCSSVFFVDKPEVEPASPTAPPAPPPPTDVTAADVRERATVPGGAEPAVTDPAGPEVGEPVEADLEPPEPGVDQPSTPAEQVAEPMEPAAGPIEPAAADEGAGVVDPPETEEESSPWIDTPSVVDDEDWMVPTYEDEEAADEDALEEETIGEVEVEPAEPVGEPEVRETTADDFSPIGLGTTEVVPDEEIAPGDDPSAGVAPETAPDTSEEVQGFTFGRRDPHEKARRLARVLVSDMIMYNPERHARALANDTLEDDFEDEIEKSWKEYVEQVGREMASDTTYFTDALNDILAKGDTVFDARE